MTQEELLKEIKSQFYDKSGTRFNSNIYKSKNEYHLQLIQLLKEYTNHIPSDNIREQIFILENNLQERPKCYCGNEMPWTGEYKEYCSRSCQRKSPKRNEKIKELWKNKSKEEKLKLVEQVKRTKLEKYGDENYNNGKKISETLLSKSEEEWAERTRKQKQTKLELYGDENYCNGKKISEAWQNKTQEEIDARTQKSKETSLERYGVEHYMQLDETKDKLKQTWLEKYGVEHPMFTQECKDKVQNTKAENGTLQNNPEIIEKTKETNLEKYGAVTFTASNEGKEQVFKTKEERYGNGKYCNIEKVRESLLAKSDEEWEEIVQKRKETCLEKYGVISYAQSNERRIKNFTETYNQYIKRYKEQNIEIQQSLEDYIDLRLQNPFVSVKMKCLKCNTEFDDRLHVNGSTSICKICNPYKFTKEREIGEFLESLGINVKYKDRSLIYPYEIDVLLEEYKIGIEFNGLMFHSFGKNNSDIFNNYELESEFKHKHLMKTELVEDIGYQLFHINEDEWDNEIKQDIWKSLILNKLGLNERIFARQCYIEEIDSKTAREFLEENHLQGFINSEIKIGLFFNKSLVSVMTFSKPRYNKDVEYELIRFASKKYLNVVGGASKILKYFERKYKPKSILSYANRRWSIGNVYTKLEFQFIEKTNPNYFYFTQGSLELESRIKYQKHKLNNILPDFREELTETENMYNNGFRKIYDSGNLKYIKEYNYE